MDCAKHSVDVKAKVDRNNNSNQQIIRTTTMSSDAHHHHCHGEDGALLRDQLGALLQQEDLYAIRQVPCLRDISNSSNNKNRPELEEWRRKICQWSYRVIDHFRL